MKETLGGLAQRLSPIGIEGKRLSPPIFTIRVGNGCLLEILGEPGKTGVV